MLPEDFIEWAYFGRVKALKKLLSGDIDSGKFIIEMTRHTPVLCTARVLKDGSVFVNAKVVGAGFVPKYHLLRDVITKLRTYIARSSNTSIEEYRKEGLKLLLDTIYFDDRERAYENIDFEKIAMLEIASKIPWSSKHTWKNLQENKRVCLLYYMPPTISFELHGTVEVYTNGPYYEYVNLVHDIYHNPKSGRSSYPCLIMRVEEVYDNSPSSKGFGKRLS